MGRGHIRVGTLLVPSTAVAKTLHRYAKPLVLNTDNEQFPYVIRGTATALKLGKRHFYFFCRHQLQDYDPSKVCIFPTSAMGTQLIGGGTGRFFEQEAWNVGEELLDVFAMEIEPRAYEIPNLELEFFPIIGVDCWPNGTTGDLFAYGVPSKLQGYKLGGVDGDTLKEINFITALVSGRHLNPSNARGVHRAEFIRSERFDVDGMSGGPVFHIGRDRAGLFIGFAGMIMRGGDTQFHFINSLVLRKFEEA